jgi:hypothetical protein
MSTIGVSTKAWRGGKVGHPVGDGARPARGRYTKPANTRLSDAALAALAGLAMLLATAAVSPAAAEPDARLLVHLEEDVLGPAVTRGQLQTELGGFNAGLPPAGATIQPETSAIILWDDCCTSGRSPRNRAHNGTIRATSSY